MLKNVFQKLLNKSGKEYKIDSQIPNLLIFYTLSNRAFMLLRGFLKTGRKVYVGSKTKIYNSKKMAKHQKRSKFVKVKCTIKTCFKRHLWIMR